MADKFTATHCYDRQSDTLQVTACGLAEPEDIFAMYNKIMALSDRYDCHRALIDMRHMQKQVDDERLMAMIDQLDSLLRRIRVARVINTHDPQQQLVQSIADTRNYPLRNFTSEASALTWLMSGLD
ncbi:hypothetical protein [Lacimicrobium sp. SS2-24]|uniref:hypothetical protein n=1 Tax=Lacimicrobium sp. SS2-24 TaxID=2005569 RepID=UPI001131D689|nr:hypothetical protein [Lacimicrobium sp. SS2-24]